MTLTPDLPFILPLLSDSHTEIRPDPRPILLTIGLLICPMVHMFPLVVSLAGPAAGGRRVGVDRCPRFPTRIKRMIRHLKPTNVLLRAGARSLLNGDRRSPLVFATLATWSVLSIVLINRREAAWVKPAVSIGWGREAFMLVSGLIVSAVIGHPVLCLMATIAGDGFGQAANAGLGSLIDARMWRRSGHIDMILDWPASLPGLPPRSRGRSP